MSSTAAGGGLANGRDNNDGLVHGLNDLRREARVWLKQKGLWPGSTALVFKNHNEVWERYALGPELDFLLYLASDPVPSVVEFSTEVVLKGGGKGGFRYHIFDFQNLLKADAVRTSGVYDVARNGGGKNGKGSALGGAKGQNAAAAGADDPGMLAYQSNLQTNTQRMVKRIRVDFFESCYSFPFSAVAALGDVLAEKHLTEGGQHWRQLLFAALRQFDRPHRVFLETRFDDAFDLGAVFVRHNAANFCGSEANRILSENQRKLANQGTTGSRRGDDSEGRVLR